MKVRALHAINDVFGVFGEKATGEVFDIEDENRANKLIQFKHVELVETVKVEPKVK
jgi:hypothetical protein